MVVGLRSSSQCNVIHIIKSKQTVAIYYKKLNQRIKFAQCHKALTSQDVFISLWQGVASQMDASDYKMCDAVHLKIVQLITLSQFLFTKQASNRLCSFVIRTQYAHQIS